MRHYVFLCTGWLSFLYAYLLTVSVDVGSRGSWKAEVVLRGFYFFYYWGG